MRDVVIREQGRPTLRLNARRLGAGLALLMAAAGAVQLLLGSSLAVVLMAVLTAVAGLLVFGLIGAGNLGAWVSLFYVLGNVVVAVAAKTALGQPLESYLHDPIGSFAAVAASTLGLVAALLLVKKVHLGRPIFEPTSDVRFLFFLSWISLALGAASWLANRHLQDPSGSGFGGLALFRNLMLMAVVARTGALLERSGRRTSFDIRLGLILAVTTLAGLLDNSKAAAALPVISYFATLLFYRRGLTLRSAIALSGGTAAFVVVVAPAIHALRALGQHEVDLERRIQLVATSGSDLLKGTSELDRFEQLAAGQFQHGYYDYFGGGGTGQMIVGRYASVQQIDPVVAEVRRQGVRGGAAIWPAIARLVPSSLYPQKPRYNEAFNTLVGYGLIDAEGGKFPTLPLAGQAYAAYGIPGVLVIPFLTFLLFFLVVKKLGWQLYGNVYGIFFFSAFVVVYAAQGDFGQYFGAALRSFPLYGIVFWLIAQAFRVRVRGARPVRSGGWS